MFQNVKVIGLFLVAVGTLFATNSKRCISQEPETEAFLAPVIVRVGFWKPEIPKSVSVDFYNASFANRKWNRGNYIMSIRTLKNGNLNDQVIRGQLSNPRGTPIWVQLNYTTRSGEKRVYCLIYRVGNPGVWFHAGANDTSLQP